jgi:hypothetical protein
MEQYTPLPPHTLSEEEAKYVAGLSAEQKELHVLAVEMLGSSYFVGRTHGFRKWVATQENKSK